MFWLIETKDQLNRFFTKDLSKVFVEIIPFSFNTHPADYNPISLVYVKPLDSKGHIIAINHSETLKGLGLEWLNKCGTVYVRDKKEFLHYYYHANVVDLTLNKPNYQKPFTPSHNYFYSKHPNKENLNTIIPVTKHYEYCENLFNELKSEIDVPINDFYNRRSTVVFYALETSGIHIDAEKFSNQFYSTNREYVYPSYNFKTITTRP